MVYIRWLLLFLPNIFGFQEATIKLSKDFFTKFDVKFVCLLTCQLNNWNHKFAKSVSTHSIATSAVNLANATRDTRSVKMCLKRQFTSLGVIIDATCPTFEDIVHYASENMWFDSNHKWLIINDEVWDSVDSKNDLKDKEITKNVKNDSKVYTIFAKLNISIDADITMAVQKDSYEYILYEIFNFGKVQGGNLSVNELGIWIDTKGIQMDSGGYKYYRRWDFQQWSMRMIAVISTPPKTFDIEMITGNNPIKGVSHFTRNTILVLNVVAEIHNFRFVYTICDRWIGSFHENSSRVASNTLFFREQDVTPVLRMALEIHDKVQLIYPSFVSIETRYYYRIPTHGTGKFENKFLTPLSSTVWICVLIIAVLCTVILLLTAKLEHRPSSVQYAVFSVIASFCQQFFEDVYENGTRKESTARKLTLLITGLSCVLIYNYYTSSVVSWLLKGPPPSINSLEELMESPLKLVYEDMGYTRTWLQVPHYYYNKRNAKVEDEMRRRKVFNKEGKALLKPLNEGIEMVKAGGYAYHTEKNSANNLISRLFTQTELCELGTLHSMEKTDLYPALQKESPYKEFLSWSLLRLQERGVISCIKRRTVSLSISCEGSLPRALALGGAAPAFLLLASGYLIGIFVMIVERYIKKYEKCSFWNKQFVKRTDQNKFQKNQAFVTKAQDAV